MVNKQAYDRDLRRDLRREGAYVKQDRNRRVGDVSRMVIFQRVTWVSNGHGKIMRLDYHQHPPTRREYDVRLKHTPG